MWDIATVGRDLAKTVFPVHETEVHAVAPDVVDEAVGLAEANRQRRQPMLPS